MSRENQSESGPSGSDVNQPQVAGPGELPTIHVPRPGLGPEIDPPKPDIPDHELISCIGRGSYGDVWLARNIMGTWRAVKVVYRSTFDNERPFEREFQGIQRFEPISRSHPSQVDILHIGRNDEAGYFYYVMELADDDSKPAMPVLETEEHCTASEPDDVEPGTETATSTNSTWMPREIDPATYQPRTLRSELRKAGHLSFNRSLRISMSLATALHHLHRHRLVHRDIKPANIIFVNGLPKLADIGLVAEVGESRTIVGTEGYLAPEGSGAAQADIYSLGKVMYDMVFGRKGQNFPELPSDWANMEEQAERLELNEIILRARETDPVSRYASAGELSRDLELIRSGRSVKRLRWLEQRQKTFVRTAALGALVAVLALAGWWWQKRQADVQRELTNTIQTQANDLQARTDELQKTSEDLRRNLYAADMLAAQGFIDRGIVLPAKSILERYAGTTPEEDLRGFEWRYLWAGIQPQPLQQYEHNGTDVCVTPDGRLLITGTVSVKLLDVESGELIGGLPVAAPEIVSFSLSRSGRYLAVGSDKDLKLTQGLSGSDAGLVEIWDLAATNAPVASLRAKAPRVEFSRREEDLLAVGVGATTLGSSGGETVLWDFKTGETLTLPESGGRASLSPNGKYLATGHVDRKVSIWTLPQGRILRKVAIEDSRSSALRFSREDKWLAVGQVDGTVLLWDLGDGEVTPITLGEFGTSPIQEIRFSDHDERIIWVAMDGSLSIWDIHSKTLLRNTPRKCGRPRWR